MSRPGAGGGRRRSGLLCLLAAVVLAPGAGASDAARERARILAPTNDFSAPETWEALPGGTATNRTRLGKEAFSQPSANLSFVQRGDFFVGNGFFRRTWVIAPASTQAADGLGPLYNARSCQRCHLRDGRGHPPAHAGDDSVSMLLRLSVPPRSAAQRRALAAGKLNAIPEPVYGTQLQDRSIPGHRPEGRLRIDYATRHVSLDGGERASLSVPTYRVVDLGYGPLHPATRMSPRVAPPMIGLGLLEAVADADILAHADPLDRDGDGVSGRPNRVWSQAQGRRMLGRFGWKAGQATIADQAAAAMAGDIGVSNPLAPGPWGECTAAQAPCRAATHGAPGGTGAEEAEAAVMDAIVFYSRHLAVPRRRGHDRPEVLRGKRLFYAGGCPACHVPKFATRSGWEDAALGGQLIWPYSDLLLHDMGPELADGRPEGGAGGSEWRTAPLWGIGLTQTVNGHTRFLHDGRARNLTEAVLWHGGEASAARERFRRLAGDERRALLAFLESL